MAAMPAAAQASSSRAPGAPETPIAPRSEPPASIIRPPPTAATPGRLRMPLCGRPGARTPRNPSPRPDPWRRPSAPGPTAARQALSSCAGSAAGNSARARPVPCRKSCGAQYKMPATMDGWLVTIAQLPTEDPAARMRVLRTLESLGAAVMREGAFLLPDTATNRQALEALAEYIVKSAGTAQVLQVNATAPAQHETLPRLFDRS